MATKPKLNADLSGEPVDQTDYHSKIGSLMYLTSIRPDIVQAVCYCARYQARPTKKHLKEVKRIFRYLRGTIHMRLWYPKGSGFELTAFLDADHAGCIDTRKSTSRGIQFLEAEYVALSASCAQVMWMRTQLQEYGFNYNKIPLYCDSQSAIAISCNPVQHSRTKQCLLESITFTYQVYQERLLASFQDDAKFEHVGQDTRSQGGKHDQDKQGKDLKISELKTKSKDNNKGSRSKITKHEGTSLQQDKYQDKDKSLTTNAILMSVGSTAPLEKCCEIRKLDSMSYHAPGACLRPYRAFFSLILVDGASWLIEVDTRELAKITALRVAAS
ncbi:hypothetical protein Tco_0425045 [Tanacetum coccineum]